MTVTVTGGKYANNTIAAGTATTITSGSASIAATNTFAAGNLVSFSATTGTSGGQVVVGTIYYVIATGLSGSAFQVSATLGGTAITFNASGTPTVILATSVTAVTANFVSTDFTVQRIVGMWNSGGTTLLGMAYVRSFVSTTVLTLETAFYDPANPTVSVAQTAGNVIIVSKNFTDSVATGLTVSNGIATLTAGMVFGTSSSATAVCFYDQDIDLTVNYTTTASTTYINFSILGGLVVFGKLENATSTGSIVSNPVNIQYGSGLNTAGSGYMFGILSGYASANFVMYGGQISGVGITIPIYHGGYTGTVGYTMIYNGVTTGYNFTSPSLGATWGANHTRMQLINCCAITTLVNAISFQWGDGIQIGSWFKYPMATSLPIAALGAATGNLAVGSLPGQRASIVDFGANQVPGASSSGSPVLVTGSSNTWNITNIIATSYRAGTGTNPSVTSATSVVVNVYFQDTFSNLAPTSVGNINTTGLNSATTLNLGTPCIIGPAAGTLSALITGFNTFVAGQIVQFSTTVGTSGGQVVAGTNYYVLATGLTSSTFEVSATLNGTAIVFNAAGLTTAYSVTGATTWSPALLYGVWTGFSQTTATPAAWYYSIIAYGYLPVFGTITPSNYQLVNATAKNVSFGTSIIQTVDPGVGSVTQAVAAAYTTISTLDQLYAAMSNWASLTSTNATYPTLPIAPITYSGSQLNLGAMSLVLASTGSAFSINTSTNVLTINCTTLATGTIFTSFTTTGSVTLGTGVINVPYTCSTGSQGSLTLTGLTAGSSIWVGTALGGTQIAYVASSTTSYQVFIPVNTGSNYIWRVALYGYLTTSRPFNPQIVSTEIVSLTSDTGITQATVATVAAYTQVVTIDQIYDYSAYLQTQNGTGGISVVNLVTKVGTNCSFASMAMIFNANTGVPVLFTVTAGVSTTVNIKVGTAAVISTGTTFTTFSTTSTTTYNSSITQACVFTNSSGTNTQLTVNNLPTSAGAGGTRVALIDNTGTQLKFPVTTTGSVVIYSPPATAYPVSVKMICYQYFAQTIILNVPGYITLTGALQTDPGITQTTRATVAAYTTLTTLDQIYDFLSSWEGTQASPGSSTVTRPATPYGKFINFGNCNIVFDGTTSTTYAFTAGTPNTLTFASPTLAVGTTFSGFETTGTVTLQNGAVINCQYSYATGAQVPIILNNLIVGSVYAVINASNGTIIFSGTAATSSITLWYTWTTNISVYVKARYYSSTNKYIPFKVTQTITNTGLTVYINQTTDSIGS